MAMTASARAAHQILPDDDPHNEHSPMNIPVPDPSLMTTKQLQREIFGLRELLEVRLGAAKDGTDGVRAIIETRLNDMDKAMELLQDTFNRVPVVIDEKIRALADVQIEKFAAMLDTHTEKFNSIQTQFRERDVRTEQSSKDSKVAVDAALQAAKEAVGEQNKSSALAIAKSETSTTKQIDQLATSIQQMTKAFDDKVVDVKDRLTRIEGKGEGTERTQTVQQTGTSLMVSVVSLFIGFAGVIAALVVGFVKLHG